MDTQAAEKFDTWGVLEIMGHLRLAGRLSEQVIAGAPFLRIDVPGDGATLQTRFFGGSSIYSITPTDEATARRVAAHHQAEPIHRWELLPPGKGQPRPYEIDQDEEVEDAGPDWDR